MNDVPRNSGAFKKTRDEKSFTLRGLYVSINSGADKPWTIENVSHPGGDFWPGADTLILRRESESTLGERIWISLTKPKSELRKSVRKQVRAARKTKTGAKPVRKA